MASRDESNRVRLQVWVTVDLADRLVVAAQEQDRSVSKEASRRLEASFGAAPVVVRDSVGSARVVSTPLPREDPQPLPEVAAEVVERLRREVPAVRPASAFPAVPQDLAGGSKPRPRSG